MGSGVIRIMGRLAVVMIGMIPISLSAAVDAMMICDALGMPHEDAITVGRITYVLATALVIALCRPIGVYRWLNWWMIR